MKKIILLALATTLISACSSPNDIVLGPEPLKQMAEQGEKFKRMTEEDRLLLASYLAVAQVGKAFGAEVKPVTGRTVGEVLVDARSWKKKAEEAAVLEKKREAEALALKEKVAAERKEISARIENLVTIAVVDKKVFPKNFESGRYSDFLMIRYALENKSGKIIKQIKGIVSFVDATGDNVGQLHVDFDQPIQAGATIKTDTGSGWNLNSFSRGNIEKIAERDFSSMKGKFTPLSIAFEDGEILKAPD